MSDEDALPLIFQKLQLSSLNSRLIDHLCIVLFIFGISGNLFGLLIFSSSCRYQSISSAYVYLATSSSVTNLLCIIRYGLILHSQTRILLGRFVGESWWACKIFELSFSFRVISSWITLFWMFERIICLSKRLKRFFLRPKPRKRHLIVAIFLLTFILVCTTGPPLYFYQPYVSLNVSGQKNETSLVKYSCTIDLNCSKRWKEYFHQIEIGLNHFTIRCLFSEIIPTVAIILFNLCIISRILRSSGRLNGKQVRRRSWLNTVLIVHSFLFLTSLFAHMCGHFNSVDAHESWWVALAVLTNCSLNFYVYCLSGRAFRNQIRRFIRSMRRSSHI